MFEKSKKVKTCPNCGCQIYDPFAGTTVVHDIDSCNGIKTIDITPN